MRRSLRGSRLIVVRLLVACQACHRQYDASTYPIGSRFRCHCGEIVRVEQPEAHEAVVVRCSACGAPRGDGPNCNHCGSAFAKFEQDMTSICPHCTTRVSDHARFCHSCGKAIAVDGTVGDVTDKICPACGGDQRMHSRALGPDLSLLECSACAGLWVGHKTFDHVIRRAEEMVTDFAPTKAANKASVAVGAVQYRPCPECAQLMNRSQYGRYSRVIVDTCKAHGVFLDEGELTQILEWVREGGLDRSRQLQHQKNVAQLKDAARAAAMGRAMASSGSSGRYNEPLSTNSVLFSLFRF